LALNINKNKFKKGDLMIPVNLCYRMVAIAAGAIAVGAMMSTYDECL
jgi:hypothetical protein